ncbi:MAG: hypothetical protein OEX10_01780 [Candidatus Bathyarchaeota archaeon]|nr:hypothetical protein [Candidatus Bathyarchaeota archaeon]MDH5662943.1 hypothetical protein [Candidatus Bathyarchaeota archaeon]
MKRQFAVATNANTEVTFPVIAPMKIHSRVIIKNNNKGNDRRNFSITEDLISLNSKTTNPKIIAVAVKIPLTIDGLVSL